MPPGTSVRDIELHTCEKGTFADRKGTVVDVLVVHYTACSGLPRITPVVTPTEDNFIKRILDRAVKLPGLTRSQADRIFEMVTNDGEISDALRLCIQAAGLPREASWHYCIASQQFHEKPFIDVVEFVDPALQAHHIGPLGKPTNLRSIGIECSYPGYLSRKLTEAQAEQQYEDWGWPKPTLEMCPDRVKRWFTEPSDEQCAALVDLCVRLFTRIPTLNAICSHYLFAPKKRIDPDPPYSLTELRAVVSERVGRKIYDRPQGSPKKA